MPLFKNYKIEDILNTFVEHIGIQINKSIKDIKSNVLITGGGAFNDYLIERIEHHNNFKNKFILPSKNLIIYKESIIFGFLGLMKYLNYKNIENSVTGSKYSSSSGIIINNKFF